jgi:hypothetical protein
MIERARITKVEFVHFSEMNGFESTGAASLSDESARENLTKFMAKHFPSDDLPEELRERLLMHGYIKIDSKRLFGADRYVISDRIAAVENNRVHLEVADDEQLLKG